MALSMPSGTNTYLPQMVQDNLIVGYARNKEDYSLNQYIQIVPTPKNQAYYLFIDGKAAVRLTNSDLRNIIWPDGTPRPSGDNNVAEHEFKPVATTRKSFEYTVGHMGVEQAAYDIHAVNSGFQGNRLWRMPHGAATPEQRLRWAVALSVVAQRLPRRSRSW